MTKAADKKGFAPGVGLSVATLLGLVALVALGTWQLQRLTWKENLIESIDAARIATPVPLDAALGDFKRVHFKGTILEAASVCIFGTNSVGDVGLFQLHPVRHDNGSVLLVNMGWINRDKHCDRYEGSKETVDIVGILRASQEPSRFTPPHDVENRIWYLADLQEMRAYYDYPTLLPYFLDAVVLGDDVEPRESLMRLTLTNNHLQYAITWFSLAMTLLIIYVIFGFKRGREKT